MPGAALLAGLARLAARWLRELAALLDRLGAPAARAGVAVSREALAERFPGAPAHWLQAVAGRLAAADAGQSVRDDAELPDREAAPRDAARERPSPPPKQRPPLRLIAQAEPPRPGATASAQARPNGRRRPPVRFTAVGERRTTAPPPSAAGTSCRAVAEPGDAPSTSRAVDEHRPVDARDPVADEPRFTAAYEPARPRSVFGAMFRTRRRGLDLPPSADPARRPVADAPRSPERPGPGLAIEGVPRSPERPRPNVTFAEAADARSVPEPDGPPLPPLNRPELLLPSTPFRQTAAPRFPDRRAVRPPETWPDAPASPWPALPPSAELIADAPPPAAAGDLRREQMEGLWSA